jgi:hypothetical protein
MKVTVEGPENKVRLMMKLFRRVLNFSGESLSSEESSQEKKAPKKQQQQKTKPKTKD